MPRVSRSEYDANEALAISAITHRHASQTMIDPVDRAWPCIVEDALVSFCWTVAGLGLVAVIALCSMIPW